MRRFRANSAIRGRTTGLSTSSTRIIKASGCARVIAVNAVSKSLGNFTSIEDTVNRSDCAARCVSPKSITFTGFAEFQRTATRDILGTASLRTSISFALKSGLKNDIPVILPPGRARLATNPARTGSPLGAMTIGIVRVACFAARTSPSPPSDNDIDLEAHQLGDKGRQAFWHVVRRSNLEREILAFDVAQVPQRRHQWVP